LLLLSLPRLERRWRAAADQLDALGIPFKLVQCRDAREPEVLLLTEQMQPPRQRRPGIAALWACHLAVVDYFARSPLHRLLMLEDDVIFHADFPRAFDARARCAPDDWRILYLGAYHRTFNISDAALAASTFSGVDTSSRDILGAFAVGLHREAAAVVARDLAASRNPMDEVLARMTASPRWAYRTATLWPPVAFAEPWSGSTLGHVQNFPVATWSRRHGFQARFFDVDRGYHEGGEAGTEPVCSAAAPAGAGAGGDGVAAWEPGVAYRTTPAAAPAACCAACVAEWPRCRFWTHQASAGGLCYLKRSRQGRRPAAGFASGGVGGGVQGGGAHRPRHRAAGRARAGAPTPPPRLPAAARAKSGRRRRKEKAQRRKRPRRRRPRSPARRGGRQRPARRHGLP
jgi:hypothetical protein